MYQSGQVIWDKDKKCPVQILDTWDFSEYPKRHTHFVKNTGVYAGRGETGVHREAFEIACPKTVQDAHILLDKGLIVPSPTPPSHCWRCGQKSCLTQMATCKNLT